MCGCQNAHVGSPKRACQPVHPPRHVNWALWATCRPIEGSFLVFRPTIYTWSMRAAVRALSSARLVGEWSTQRAFGPHGCRKLRPGPALAADQSAACRASQRQSAAPLTAAAAAQVRRWLGLLLHRAFPLLLALLLPTPNCACAGSSGAHSHCGVWRQRAPEARRAADAGGAAAQVRARKLGVSWGWWGDPAASRTLPAAVRPA